MEFSERPKKVIHVITSLGGGGTENYLHQLLSRSPSSWQNEVLFLGKDGVIGERIRELGVPLERIPSPWDLARVLRARKPNVLHTCLYWAHQIGRWVGRRVEGLRIVSSHQAIDIWQKPWHRLLDQWSLPLCDCVVVNSEAAGCLIGKRLNGRTPRPPVVKIENGLDFDCFAPRNRETARQAYPIPPRAVVGGTLIRLHPEKGAEKIPAFADAVLKAHPNLILLIAGTGPLEQRLKEATKGWHDRLRWLGWQDDTVQFLSSLDFFWLLSREESFPQALLEASGMALPWIAPDVGGIRELLESGAAGLLYPAGDLTAAVGRSAELLRSRDVFTESAKKALPALKTRYALDRMVKAFYDLLEHLTSNPI